MRLPQPLVPRLGGVKGRFLTVSSSMPSPLFRRAGNPAYDLSETRFRFDSLPANPHFAMSE
jgi:hypothetical protein